MWDDSAKILSQSLPREAIVSSSGTDIDHPLFDVVHPAFPLATAVSPNLRGALMEGCGEAVVARDMLEPCEFLPLDRCQKGVLWARKEVDFAPHPVVGLLICGGKFSQQGWSMSHSHN